MVAAECRAGPAAWHEKSAAPRNNTWNEAAFRRKRFAGEEKKAAGSVSGRMRPGKKAGGPSQIHWGSEREFWQRDQCKSVGHEGLEGRATGPGRAGVPESSGRNGGNHLRARHGVAASQASVGRD